MSDTSPNPPPDSSSPITTIASLKRTPLRVIIVRFVLRRGLLVAPLVLSMGAYSRADKAYRLADQVSSRPSPVSSHSRTDSPDAAPKPRYHTLLTLGSSVALFDSGPVRLGESLDGWRLDSIDEGAAFMSRGDRRVVLRPRGLLPASPVPQ